MTVMPCGARSSAALCERPRTANLLAQYAAERGSPRLPAMEDAPTSRPPRPCLIICRAACL